VENTIFILGTGGDSVVVGRQLRGSGGIVIVTPHTQLHIDPGPGALVHLAKNELHPRETTAILLSHQHIAHASDAAALIAAMTHNGMDKRGLLISNTLEPPLCLVPEYVQQWTEKSLTIAQGKRIGVNDIEIKAIEANHYNTSALSYLIRTPTYLLGYTGDTKYSAAWASEFKGCNILVINCKFPAEHAEGDNLDADDAVKLIEEIKPQLAIITHFGVKMMESDPLTQARRMQQQTGVQVVAAKDGLKVAPSSFHISPSQKTLGNF
jgi:ribonuclease BN (tRNA processing enzyme)